MQIVKLTEDYLEKVKPLFSKPIFMGVNRTDNYFAAPGDNQSISDLYYEAFISTYLSGSTNYHAYCSLSLEGEVTSMLSFYESDDDASWYGNQIRSLGNNSSDLKLVLDRVIEHNEANGRYKFYSMFPKKYINTYRRLMFSKFANERYDYFDEFSVDVRHQCHFILPWQILYNRVLYPVDTIVRCSFLKQKYRTTLYNAGRL
jgi:hypothetical protein